jgi:adenylate cyclase class IV
MSIIAMEVEFKYRANDISLVDFTAFCKARTPEKIIHASGFDYFYEDKADPDCFGRHRVGPSFNQLTFKRKTTGKNNFVRDEDNVTLGADMTREKIQLFCERRGYKFNTSIFKNVFVYEYAQYTLVYYVVYDEELKELGRFIEIEMSEEYPWESEDHAWRELVKLEQEAKALGLSPQRRVRNSLFEMFRR